MGEVIRLDEARARTLVRKVRAQVTEVRAAILELWNGHAWEVLGYTSWDELCRNEFDGVVLQLPRDEQRELHTQLDAEGMTIRAISSATGAGYGTVHRDLALATDPIGSIAATHKTGVNGKRYSRRNAHRNDPGRLERIRELASAGHGSAQIATALGRHVDYVRALAREHGITIPADRMLRGQRRMDHTRIVDETVTALEGLASGLRLLDITRADPRDAQHWASSLADSLRQIHKLQRNIREMAQHGDSSESTTEAHT